MVPPDPSRGPALRSIARAVCLARLRCDIYSFGLMLWEVMHQEVPFADLTGLDASVLAGSGERPSMSLAGDRAIFIEIITNCWHRDPLQRPNMTDVTQVSDETRNIQQKLASPLACSRAHLAGSTHEQALLSAETSLSIAQTSLSLTGSARARMGATPVGIAGHQATLELSCAPMHTSDEDDLNDVSHHTAKVPFDTAFIVVPAEP